MNFPIQKSSTYSMGNVVPWVLGWCRRIFCLALGKCQEGRGGRWLVQLGAEGMCNVVPLEGGDGFTDQNRMGAFCSEELSYGK